jgi:hypothetical protein
MVLTFAMAERGWLAVPCQVPNKPISGGILMLDVTGLVNTVLNLVTGLLGGL